MAIIDIWQVQGRGKQCKCLMHGYLPYKYKWINIRSLPHSKCIIKAFEHQKMVEINAAYIAKATIKTSQWSPREKSQ